MRNTPIAICITPVIKASATATVPSNGIYPTPYSVTSREVTAVGPKEQSRPVPKKAYRNTPTNAE